MLKCTRIIILCLILAILVGCGTYERPDPDKFGTSYYRGINYERDRDRLLALYNRRRLEKAIEGLVEVKDATVLVDGEFCYIGLEIDEAVKENTNVLQQQVGSIVRKNDKKIERVYITTDTNDIKRLKTLVKEIDKGKKIDDYMEEIQAMFQ